MADPIITAIQPVLSSLHLSINGNSGNSTSNRRHLHRRTQSQFDFKTSTQSDNSETISPVSQTPPPSSLPTVVSIPCLTPTVRAQQGHVITSFNEEQDVLKDLNPVMNTNIQQKVESNLLQYSPESQIFFNSQIVTQHSSALPQAQLEQQKVLVSINSSRQSQESDLSKIGGSNSSSSIVCNSDLLKLEDHMQDNNTRIQENQDLTQEQLQQQCQLLEKEHQQQIQQPLTTQQMIEYMQQKQIETKQQIIETIDEDFSRFPSSNSSNCFQFGKKRLRNDHFESVSTSQTALSHLAEQLSLQHLEKGTPVLQTIPEQEIIASEYQAISHPGSTRHNEESTAKKGLFFSDQLQEQEQYSASKSLLKSTSNEGNENHSIIESSPLLAAQSSDTQIIKYSTSAGFYVAPFDNESGQISSSSVGASLSPAFFSSSPSKPAGISSSAAVASASSLSEKRYFPSVKKQQQKQLNIQQTTIQPLQQQQQQQQQLIQSLKNITSSGQFYDQLLQSQQLQNQQQQQQQSHRKQCSLSDEMEGSLRCLQAQFAQLQKQQQQQQTHLVSSSGKTLSALKNRPPNQQILPGVDLQESIFIQQPTTQQQSLSKKKTIQNNNNNNNNNHNSSSFLQLSQSPQPLLKKQQQPLQNSSQYMSNSVVIAPSSSQSISISATASNKAQISSSQCNHLSNNLTNLTIPQSSSSPQQYFHYQFNSPIPQHPASCTACYSDRPPCSLNRTRQTNSDRRHDSTEPSLNLLNHTFTVEDHSQNSNGNQDAFKQQHNQLTQKDIIEKNSNITKSNSNRSTQALPKNTVNVAASKPCQLPNSDRTNNIPSTSIVNTNNQLFYSQSQYARKKPAKNAHSSSSTAISNYTINTNTKAENSILHNNTNNSHDQIRQFINQIAGSSSASSKKIHQSTTTPVTTAFLADINTSIKKIQGAHHQRKTSAGTTTTTTATTLGQSSSSCCPTGSLLFPFSSTSVTPNSFCITAPRKGDDNITSQQEKLISGQSQLCHSAGTIKHQQAPAITNILTNCMPFPMQYSDTHIDNSIKNNQEQQQQYQEYHLEQSRKTDIQDQSSQQFEELQKIVFILLERINQLESSNSFLLSSMGQLIKDKEIDKKQLQKIESQTLSNQRTIATLSKLLASRNIQPKPESDTRIYTDYSSSESRADALQSKFQAKDSILLSQIESSSSQNPAFNSAIKYPNNSNKHNNNSSVLQSLFEKLSSEQQHNQQPQLKLQQQQQQHQSQQYPAVSRLPQNTISTATQIQKYLQKDQPSKPFQQQQQQQSISSPIPYYQIQSSPLQKAATSQSLPLCVSSSSPTKITWQQSPQRLSASSQREDLDWQMEDSSRNSSERQEQQYYYSSQQHSQDPLVQSSSCSCQHKNGHINNPYADQLTSTTNNNIHNIILSQPQLKMNKSVSQPNSNNHKNTNIATSNSSVSAFSFPQAISAQLSEQTQLTPLQQQTLLQKQFASGS